MNVKEFDLSRLIKTIFQPKGGERVGVFIDLPNLRDVVNFKYLSQSGFVTQRIAHDVFYQGLLREKSRLGLGEISFFAYAPTGGSNLELPATVITPRGDTLDLVREVLARLDIALYLSTYSATAPLTAFAKKMGFRGATMHGCNQVILETGLSRDYNEVSVKAERFRQAVTACDKVEIEFGVDGIAYSLTLDLGAQEAQKSHGLCPDAGDVANLPAGEIYWVPASAHGQMPMVFKEDRTVALMEVRNGRIESGKLLRGNQDTLDRALATYKEDPATGHLGELGLGTQQLPVAGADIQDEKILGTFHVATGRDDHLGGKVDAKSFKQAKNATHEDILFAPHKTPEIGVNGVWMHKDGQKVMLLQNYQPTDFVRRVAL
jgi:hypothetical protein